MKIRGKAETVDIHLVDPNPWNPNKMTPEMKAKEEASLRRFGFLKSVVVRETSVGRYEIIDGEHRFEIMKTSGAVQLPVLNLGKISTAEAKQLTVLLNEIRGESDFLKLSDLFATTKDDFKPEDLAGLLPFSKEEIESLITASDFDWSGFDMDPYSGKMVTEFVSLPCRMKRDQAEWVDRKAAEVAAGLGIKGSNDAETLGLLFEHLVTKAIG